MPVLIDTVVTDMDGTLFSGPGMLSEYTLRVVRECRLAGVRVIPASGRAPASMRPYLCQMNTGLPYIASNGSELVGPDHAMLERLTFNVETGREIVAFLEEKGFYTQVYRESSFCFAEECEFSRQYQRSSGLKGIAVGDLCKFLTFETPKVLSVGQPEAVTRFLPIANERFAGRAVFTTSDPYFLEAGPIGATKGEAIARLAKRIPIDPERTMAFGDSQNDLSMFAFAEHSVAMGNAEEEVRRAARYCCRPNTEDGMARFVEEHVLWPAQGRATNDLD